MDGRWHKEIEEALGERIEGAIYGSGRIRTASGKSYFLKRDVRPSACRCEANGLRELAKPHALRIAQVIYVGEDYLLTEYIERIRPSATFHSDFGRALARMHRYHSDSFGFYEDNFIGANPQPNIPTAEERHNWIAFYFNKRLLYQYRMAERNGYVTERLKSGFLRLERSIENLLKDSAEPPTLLHGDLWSGNYLCDENGQAALIDPAVYYGHREADLAMTKVFGGFSPLFYKAYQEEYPLLRGWETREPVYKLYHILNHLNIFGTGYLSEAEHLIHQC